MVVPISDCALRFARDNNGGGRRRQFQEWPLFRIIVINRVVRLLATTTTNAIAGMMIVYTCNGASGGI